MPDTALTTQNIKPIVRAIVREEISQERTYTRQMVQQVVKAEINEVTQGIKRLQSMLEEDARAESRLLSRVDRRSVKTHRQLVQHVSNHQAHNPAP